MGPPQLGLRQMQCLRPFLQVHEQLDDWCWLVDRCRRVVLVPEPTGTPQSMQGMVVDDVDVDSVAAVSQFDKTVADSEDGDLHSSRSVSPRHRLLGDSDTESLADGASTVSIHSVVEEESQLMSFTTFEGTVWQSEKRSCLSMQSICTPSSPSEQQ